MQINNEIQKILTKTPQLNIIPKHRNQSTKQNNISIKAPNFHGQTTQSDT